MTRKSAFDYDALKAELVEVVMRHANGSASAPMLACVLAEIFWDLWHKAPDLKHRAALAHVVLMVMAGEVREIEKRLK